MSSSSAPIEELPSPSHPIEFSLTNGQLFQRVMENPSRFNLSPADRLLLEEGRKSMISYTRYGFLLGATLSPLPLFRGEYAINNLRKLPPLMDRTTQRPNPVVIRGRLLWIAQSIFVTTVGSGFGTWLGFKLGLRSMERGLSSLPGCRERVMDAFNLARKELEAAPLDPQRRASPNHDDGLRNSPRGIKSPEDLANENQDKSYQEQEDDYLLSRSSPVSTLSSSTTNPPQGMQEALGTSASSSRWEELRRSPPTRPSTWQTIREQNSRQTPPSLGPTSPPLDPSSSSSSPNDPSQSQDEFEKLLERERNLSAGIPPASDRYSSSRP